MSPHIFHIYIYIHIYIYVYIYVFIYIFIYICVHLKNQVQNTQIPRVRMSPDPEVLSSRLGSGPLRCLRGSSRLRSLRVGVAGAGLREVGALGRRGMWDKKRGDQPQKWWFIPQKRWFILQKRWFIPQKWWFIPQKLWFIPQKLWFIPQKWWFISNQTLVGMAFMGQSCENCDLTHQMRDYCKWYGIYLTNNMMVGFVWKCWGFTLKKNCVYYEQPLNFWATAFSDTHVIPPWLVVWNIFLHILGTIIPTDELHHFPEG